MKYFNCFWEYHLRKFLSQDRCKFLKFADSEIVAQRPEWDTYRAKFYKSKIKL